MTLDINGRFTNKNLVGDHNIWLASWDVKILMSNSGEFSHTMVGKTEEGKIFYAFKR